MTEPGINQTGLSDGQQAPLAERLLFENRIPVIIVFVLLTAFFAFQALKLEPDASFEKMIPTSHPYIQNYLENKADLASLSNSIRIIVASKDGDIFDKDFQEALRLINDEVFYIPGVDRSGLQSIWTPNVRWNEVTEEGFRGGAVIPNAYDGSERSLDQLRENILRSGQVGRLVANNFRSAAIIAPLTDINPETGEKLDYRDFSQSIEKLVRDKYQNDKISIHVTGFAKVVGDLIDGATLVALFFGVALVTTLLLLAFYSRCLYATLVPITCSTVAVIWQLGLLHTLGFGLDPYSMLVPFLVFAIGISHGVQIINNIAVRFFFGAGAFWSARRAFRALYIPGFVALVSDGIGFLTLMVIEIPVIQELAMTASIGVAVLIFTNLILMPILMSYSGLSKSCVSFLQRKRDKPSTLWPQIGNFAKPPLAPVVIFVAIGLFALGFYGSKDLRIGDLDPGAPELRADSRYNRDNAFLTENFATSTDVFVAMIQTPPQQCGDYATLAAVDRFQEVMKDTPGVQSVISLIDISKRAIMAMNEGNPKWHTLSRNRYILNNSLQQVPSNLINTDCSMAPILIFLNDHKAETLQGVIRVAEAFAAEYNSEELDVDLAASDKSYIKFVLAAGNAGIESVTNIVISKAQYQMLALVYSVVSFLVFLTFRSWRAVVCIILPLALTSVLGQALMALLGIGVKVATLPVIALGVGIGVDYGIYIYSKMESYLQRGMSVFEAYGKTLHTTGMAVAFTGLTLAIGVGTWIFSAIKFQADMGLMLTFMFLWNMLGALLLLPALAHYLVKPVAERG
ncbi:MAG: MMPL family transporter [Gammaproteobacteria bacterium]|nr:MMPL family transporter [Gammaproteobacteria bacterium]